MRLYHYTDYPFEINERIEVMEDGYVFWEENVLLESLLEFYRPKDKLSRRNAIFLCQVHQSQSGDHMGADGNEFIAEVMVEKNILKNRSDLNWIQPLIKGCYENWDELYEDFSEYEIEKLINGYWSGKAKPGEKPVFEFRSPPVYVCKLFSNNESILSLQGDDSALQL